jgi:hypothetical protein
MLAEQRLACQAMITQQYGCTALLYYDEIHDRLKRSTHLHQVLQACCLLIGCPCAVAAASSPDTATSTTTDSSSGSSSAAAVAAAGLDKLLEVLGDVQQLQLLCQVCDIFSLQHSTSRRGEQAYFTAPEV